MSLQHALLVSLAEREASGYDLTRRFDRSVGFFWSATHQQIYRVLARMAEAGFVDVRVEPGEGKPDRRVYSLTDAGRSELRAWSATPTPTQQLRSEFAVKVRGMNHGDAIAVLDDIRRQRAAHVEQLAYYEANAAKNFPHADALDVAQRPLYAVLRGGILTERAMIAWCDEMLALLAPTHGTRKGSETPDGPENLDVPYAQMHPGAVGRKTKGRNDTTGRETAPTTSNDATPEHGRTR